MKQIIFLKPQTGSTTLGIIVGVVLGLAVALGVSLYLANTGAPVQTRAANPAARIEPPKDVSKAPDPNEALYTKVPKVVEEAKPAEPAATPAATPATTVAAGTAQPATTVASTPEPTPAKVVAPKEAAPLGGVNNPTGAAPAKPAAVKPELDAIGKIAAIATPAPAASASPAKTTEPVAMPKPAPASAGGERYFVQAGAFSDTTQAEALKAKLALQGVTMSLSPREKDGQVLQRVRTAPLAAVDAEKLRNNLKANGIETSLVKVQ